MQHKRISFLILSVLLMVLTACGGPVTRFQQVDHLPPGTPPSPIPWKLEGEYLNEPLQDKMETELWQSLKFIRGIQWNKADKWEKCETCTVKISLEGDNNIHFTLLREGVVVDSLAYRGQYTRRTFYLKKQIAAHGPFPLFWVWMGTNLQVGVSEQGNLLVGDEYHGKVMLVLFPAFVDGGENWKTHGRVNATSAASDSKTKK